MSENEKLVEWLRWRALVLEDGSRAETTISLTQEALREAAAALRAAEARIKALSEALAPFAKAAPPRVIPDMHAMLFEGLGENCKAVLVARDFRQALSTLGGNADDR